jgi:hypothetical protein
MVVIYWFQYGVNALAATMGTDRFQRFVWIEGNVVKGDRLDANGDRRFVWSLPS